MSALDVFALPFLNGLLASLLLGGIGLLLFARRDWLAALGISQIAAAGALIGTASGIPALLAAPATALVAADLKRRLQLGALGYGVMILAGWSTVMLLAANTPLGDALAHALVDGQLYFTRVEHLAALLPLAVALPLLWKRLSRALLRARLFPEHEQANGQPDRRLQALFEWLAALLLALGTLTLGVMASFALVLLPAWTASRLAPNLRLAVLLCLSLALGAYLIAFELALRLDQPFGPVLVASALILCALTRAGHTAAMKLTHERTGTPHDRA
ncbi:MAG: metal ABC transporter permease [Halothiobacillaceae bacterium]|jgi:zinc transport system permease protein|nr:metal ABC transporter permease [Halothiobacillaceae bacterium]